MENLDKLQFILGLDEGVIYSKFGNRTNNVYAKSIKKIVPRNDDMLFFLYKLKIFSFLSSVSKLILTK